MIRFRLNGEIREARDSLSLRELLSELNLPEVGVAVAVNDAVIPRGDHPATILRDNDVVEIIHAVGGGGWMFMR